MKNWRFMSSFINWLIVTFLTFLFLFIQLNNFDFFRILTSFLNSLLIVFFTLIFSSLLSLSLLYLREQKPALANFISSLFKSFPQIITLILGYLLLNYFLKNGIVQSDFLQISVMAFILSLSIFTDPYDFLCNRVDFFKQHTFYYPMLTLGVKKERIIFKEILWKNSASLLVLKLISILGISFFLHITIDFIISLGLSYDLNNVNFLTSLGNSLALLGSKQDLLAFSVVLTDPSEFTRLFSTHLFGLSLAFLSSFSILSFFKLSISVGEELNEM